MLIILPTYKRLDSLYWVLASIMKCDLPNLDSDTARLAIVNNFPANKGAVLELVEAVKESFVESNSWKFTIINRDQTLPPVLNWYSAVEELAIDNEIVFFVGDDDPLVSTSLKSRYEVLKGSDRTMVFGRLIFGLYFSKDCTRVHLERSHVNELTGTVSDLNFADLWNWTVIHLSNHCFVYNKVFKAALNKAIKWCESQGIGSEANRKLFITYYIPIAVLLEGGKIGGLNSYVLYRGMSVDEIRNTRYSIRSWNLGYISGLAYNLLRNDDLRGITELQNDRAHFLDTFKKWYYPMLLDPRISKHELREIKHALEFSLGDVPKKQLFEGLSILIKYYGHLQGLPLLIKSLIYSKPTTEVIW